MSKSNQTEAVVLTQMNTHNVIILNVGRTVNVDSTAK